jgi:outer membrane immunogenic protein
MLSGCVARGLAIAAVMLSTTAAYADGYGSRYRGSAKDDYVAPYTWTGLYVGAHVGYAWADVDWGLAYPFAAPPPSSSFSNDGVIAGGQLGYQHQFGRWVVGGEVSLSSGFSRESKDGINLFGASTAGVLETDIDWMLLATARLGYAWDRWLGYVKGGYAGGMVSVHSDDNVPPNYEVSSRKFHNGWTVGVGAEYMVKSGMTVGVEYNYVDLGRSLTNPVIDITTGSQVGTAFSDVDTRVHSVMARLNFKFGPAVGSPLK